LSAYAKMPEKQGKNRVEIGEKDGEKRRQIHRK
jgi:hypothetical protein